MKVHLLDMGDEKYGDCLIVEIDGRTILVDGGHIRDHEPRGSAPSIPQQMEAVFGREGPFRFDLIVVTHCHGDHIGCLPTLVEMGTVAAEWALVADEDLGYPRMEAEPDGVSDDVIGMVVAGLREEAPADFRSNAELDLFLTDALKLEDRYRGMLKSLEDSGTRVVRFRGVDDPDGAPDLDALLEEFSATGLEILGPVQDHLLLCTQAIERFTRDARRAAVRARRRTDFGVLGEAAAAGSLFRLLSADGSSEKADRRDDVGRFIDRPGKGAALNDQSIVLKVGTGRDAVLLTGDMQLADAEVDEVAPFMETLLERISRSGPYAFVKLPHHGSYNGFDERVARQLAGTSAFGVTTGSNDPVHPHRDVLALLEAARGSSSWVRTDRNGLTTLTLKDGEIGFETERGTLSDGSLNLEDTAVEPSAPETRLPVLAGPATTRATPLPAASAGARREGGSGVGETVEIIARIPHRRTRVTITIDIDPEGATPADDDRIAADEDVPADPEAPGAPWQRAKLAGGRNIPRLLFVTNMRALSDNAGEREALEARRIIEDAGHTFADLRNSGDPFSETRRLLDGSGVEGVVILGGYDVLRSVRYDVLPPDLRSRLRSDARNDPDQFIVWSDQLYGDTDGDRLGDLPVSRIPDGKSAQLLRSALCGCAADSRAGRFGIRNWARPFAEDVFGSIPGSEALLVSKPTRADSLGSHLIDAAAIYIMLHGSDSEPNKFWGETANGGLVSALTTGNLPDPCGGVVFAGCCWGALTVKTTAAAFDSADPIRPLIPADSISLSFLNRGARAFVGCTGAHYSPVDDAPGADLDYFGGPLHRSFWTLFLEGRMPPARALFEAKKEYIGRMPHGRRSDQELAIEFKTLRQFTCLGLGW